MQIVIVNGKPTCGKTTFEQICYKKLGASKCLITSTIDFVKELAKTAGWDGTKTPENRAFLSDLKDLLTRWNDVPYKKVMEKIKDYTWELNSFGIDSKELVVFVDVREPKEIQKFVKRENAITLLIKRKAADMLNTSNHADADVDDYTYDYVVSNDGTLEDLEQKADKFIEAIRTRQK